MNDDDFHKVIMLIDNISVEQLRTLERKVSCKKHNENILSNEEWLMLKAIFKQELTETQ